MQKRLDKYDSNIAAARVEENVYNKLRAALEKLKVKNTVVITGWRAESKPITECDFLIISKEQKAIVQLEVMNTFSKKHFPTVLNPLKKGFRLFEEWIPFPKINEWRYIKALYFENNLSNDPQCSNCQNYILGPQSDFASWWSDIIAKISTNEPSKTYENIMKLILHQMLAQKDMITNSDIIHGEKRKKKKLLIRSNFVRELLNDDFTKRVALISGYGTGKTTLLKEKAKSVLKMKKKVVIILFQESEQDSLLLRCYQQEFRQFEMVKIISERSQLQQQGSFYAVNN